jgi:predicted glycoside hydrolase/deacetylase ChbG (UPF0249 family)
VIITADDFGASAATNAAIAEAFQQGLVTTASVMANMPGFEEACELAHLHGLRNQLGVHLVLTEGVPLTQPIRSCRRFCDGEGDFRPWRHRDRVLRLVGAERQAVIGELRAQIELCRERRLTVAHLDSHHHVHNKPGIAGVVIALARDARVARVRIARNCGPGRGIANRAAKAWINARVVRAGLAGTRWLGAPSDLKHLSAKWSSRTSLTSFELVTHPLFREGRLVDAETPELTLRQLLDELATTPC